MTEKKQLINPPGTEEIYKRMKFSQAVRAGNMMWVSGQVGIDKNMKVGEGIEEQARLAFTSLKGIIEAAGGSLADVVELVSFHTSMENMRGFAKAKNEFFLEDYPAHTAVGVTELVMPDLLVEIKATVVIGSS